jgi:DNA polymerase-3 subunit epsilon
METVAVLDFETTGLSPNCGDRATEIAITLVRDGQVVDRYQSLMNAGRRIPAEVTHITGITNAMIATAPPVAKVMREACNFVGNTPVVAHNASFDKKFWEAELAYLSLSSASVFACTMLLSRRIYPNSLNHRLSTLVQLLGLPQTGRAHRAMVDAEMTSHLWCRIQQDISKTYRIQSVNHDLLTRVQKVTRSKMPEFLNACASTS